MFREMEDHICKGKAKAWWYDSKGCSSQQQRDVVSYVTLPKTRKEDSHDSKTTTLPSFSFALNADQRSKVNSKAYPLEGKREKMKMIGKIWRIKRGHVNHMEDTCASCNHFAEDVKLECHSVLASRIFMPICVCTWWSQPKIQEMFSLHLSLKDLRRKGGSKTLRARDGEWLHGYSIIQTQRGWWTYEFTETVAAHIRPAQVQVRERGNGYKNPTPSQEAICSWYLMGTGIPVFSYGITLGVSTIFPGQVHE